MSVSGSSILQVNYRHLLKRRDTSQIINQLLAQEYSEQEFEAYFTGLDGIDSKRLFESGSDSSDKTDKPGAQDVELQNISATYVHANRQDYLCASLDDKAVCIENERVIAIIRAPDSLRGSDCLIAPYVLRVNWESRVVPVLNLTDMARLPKANPAESVRILIMKGNNTTPFVGLLVSAVSNIVTFDTEAFSLTASHNQGEVYCSKAVSSLGCCHHDIILMDIEKIAQAFKNYIPCTLDYTI